MSEARVYSIDRARRFLVQDLWSLDLRPRSLAATGTRLLQLAVMVGEGFVRDKLLLRASALTYIAMLSLIPMLAVALTIVSALGISVNLAELAVDQIAAGSPDAKAKILEVVEGVDIGSLGALGAAVLFVTTVLALRHAEETLNEIWGVARGRTWMRRFADYLAVLVTAPLLLGVAISLIPILQSQWVVQWGLQFPLFDFFYRMGLRWAPAGLLMLGFSFVYLFLPNTKVRVSSALIGGLTAAILFVIAQRLYVGFTVGSARYSVLFGSFAALPLLVTWLYVSFAIALLGAEISFAHQNLALYRREVRGEPAGPAEREAVGIRMAVEIARAFRDRAPPWTAERLSEWLDVPVRTVRSLLEQLQVAGVISPLGPEEQEVAFQLGAPLDAIPLIDILQALRGPRIESGGGGATEPARIAVHAFFQDLDEVVSSVAATRTLADMVRELPPRDSEASA